MCGHLCGKAMEQSFLKHAQGAWSSMEYPRSHRVQSQQLQVCADCCLHCCVPRMRVQPSHLYYDCRWKIALQTFASPACTTRFHRITLIYVLDFVGIAASAILSVFRASQHCEFLYLDGWEKPRGPGARTA